MSVKTSSSSKNAIISPFTGTTTLLPNYKKGCDNMRNLKDLSYLDKKRLFSGRMLMTEKSYAKALNHSIMLNTEKDRFKLKQYKKMCYDSKLPVLYYDIPKNCDRNVKAIYTNGIQINANISYWAKHTPNFQKYAPYLIDKLMQFKSAYNYMLVLNSNCIIENTHCSFTVQSCFSLIFPKLLCFMLVDFMCAVNETNAEEILAKPLKVISKRKICN